VKTTVVLLNAIFLRFVLKRDTVGACPCRTAIGPEAAEAFLEFPRPRGLAERVEHGLEFVARLSAHVGGALEQEEPSSLDLLAGGLVLQPRLLAAAHGVERLVEVSGDVELFLPAPAHWPNAENSGGLGLVPMGVGGSLAGIQRVARLAIPDRPGERVWSATLSARRWLRPLMALTSARCSRRARMAEDFCAAIAKNRKGAGFLKTLLLRRAGSSVVAGISTACKMLENRRTSKTRTIRRNAMIKNALPRRAGIGSAS
jgi:hypothetical protein